MNDTLRKFTVRLYCENRDEMVADLHSMKDVGIGSVLFLEVNIGVPTGPVSFMSEQWQDNVVNAIKTTEKLGMEFILVYRL